MKQTLDPLRESQLDFPPLRQSLKHIKFTSNENEFAAETIEHKIFHNGLTKYDPWCMSDRQRGTYIQMLKMRTKTQDLNREATVGGCYPKYDRNYQTMNSIERKEY
jgi:hypothetical protein